MYLLRAAHGLEGKDVGEDALDTHLVFAEPVLPRQPVDDLAQVQFRGRAHEPRATAVCVIKWLVSYAFQRMSGPSSTTHRVVAKYTDASRERRSTSAGSAAFTTSEHRIPPRRGLIFRGTGRRAGARGQVWIRRPFISQSNRK